MKHLIAIKQAFSHSMDGIARLLKERAFKQELVLGFLLFIIEIFRNSALATWAYLFASYVMVLLAEAINTAIEAAIDRIGMEKHELSKAAKDIGSAAVFIALTHLGIIWLCSWFI